MANTPNPDPLHLGASAVTGAIGSDGIMSLQFSGEVTDVSPLGAASLSVECFDDVGVLKKYGLDGDGDISISTADPRFINIAFDLTSPSPPEGTAPTISFDNSTGWLTATGPAGNDTKPLSTVVGIIDVGAP